MVGTRHLLIPRVSESFVPMSNQFSANSEAGLPVSLTSQDIGRFAETVHRSLHPQRVALSIANGVQSLTSVDRVAVVSCVGGRSVVLAVSSTHSLRKQSNTLRYLQRAVQACRPWNQALLYPTEGQEYPPPMEQSLSRYCDASLVASVFLVPLSIPQVQEQIESDTDAPTVTTVGYLVLESFSAPIAAEIQRGCQPLARHAALALNNAIQYQQVPLQWLTGIVAGVSRHRRRYLLGAAALVLLTVVLAMVPMEFTIPARGVLVPESRRHVYAIDDGVISTVDVEDGQAIASGAILVTLHNLDLELQLEEVMGEIQVKQETLAALKASRSRASQDTAESSENAAKEAETRRSIESLQARQERLQSRRTALTIRSPIGGRVITWDTVESLRGRPVQRGQHLLDVIDPHSAWRAEVRIAEKDAVHVLMAWRSMPDLKSRCSLVSSSNEVYEGLVLRVGEQVLSVDGEESSYLPVLVDLSNVEQGRLHPGLEVDAVIRCGQRPIGFVLFRGLVETLRKEVAFRLQ
jgi:biotin carboxyl carrier protein